MIRKKPARCFLDALYGTALDADAAFQTGFFPVVYKRLFLEPLRIMAPQAAQRTALHKYSCADAGSVVQCKPFDVKYDSRVHFGNILPPCFY